MLTKKMIGSNDIVCSYKPDEEMIQLCKDMGAMDREKGKKAQNTILASIEPLIIDSLREIEGFKEIDLIGKHDTIFVEHSFQEHYAREARWDMVSRKLENLIIELTKKVECEINSKNIVFGKVTTKCPFSPCGEIIFYAEIQYLELGPKL